MEEIILSTNKLRPGMASTVPMVCFCDISLGQISNHIDDYGNYGIGMSKEWGIEKNLNPIVYLNADSRLSSSLSDIVNSIYESLEENCTEHIKVISDEFLNVCKFLKQYSGINPKNGRQKRFYDEKEWRFVPEMTFDESTKFSMTVDEFRNSVRLQEVNEKLKDYVIVFDINDVKYIFLEKESDIHALISLLKKSSRFDGSQLELLTTRMITTQQIKEDF